MIKIKFNNEYFLREVAFSMKGPHVVEIIGIEEPNLSGFRTYKYDDESFLGDFSDYTTLYRTVDGGIQFSNDGRVYPYTPSPLLVNQVYELGHKTSALQSSVSNLQDNVSDISDTLAQNSSNILDTQEALCEYSMETSESLANIELAVCELSGDMLAGSEGDE